MKLTNLQQEAEKLRMTPAEKAGMKARLFGAPSDIQSQPSHYFFYSFQFKHFAVPVLAVLIVLLGGVGTTYAAQGTLPGDFLYSVKVKITEPVEVALAGSSAKKAQVEVEIATRRVSEAQSLATQGRLDATTTQELEKDFDTHAAQALALAGEEKPAVVAVISSASSSAASTSTNTVPMPLASSTTTPHEDHTQRAVRTFAIATSTRSGDSAEESHATSTVGISASLGAQKHIFEELKTQIKNRAEHGNKQNDGQNGRNRGQGDE